MYDQKLDPNGNFLWARQMGAGLPDQGNAIAVDASGNVYTTGYFWKTVDFDPGSAIYNLTALIDADIYIQKLDTDGHFRRAIQIGRTADDKGQAIALDAARNIYSTGYFGGQADFNPGTQNLTFSAAVWDIYVQKLSQREYTPVSVAQADDLFNQTMVVYPNPSSNIFNITFEKPIAHAVLTITDIQGKLISTTQIRNASKASIELNQAPGVYLLTIKSKEGQKTIQLIKY